MAVRKKIVLGLSVFALVSLSGLSFFRFIQQRDAAGMYDALEKKFDMDVEAKAAGVKTFVNDYSYWDDLVRFCKTGDTRWAAATFARCFKEQKLQGIWVYRPDATCVFSGHTNDMSGLSVLPLPREAYEKLFAGKRFCHFFVNTPQGLFEIHGATIHPTADPGRKTSPAGFLLAGKLWTEDYVKQIGALSLVSPMKAARGIDHRTNRVIVSRPLVDWNGRALMSAQVAAESPVISGLSRALDRQFYFSLLAVCGILFSLYFLLERWVSRPLELVYGSLDFEDMSSINKLTAEGGEFGYIARMIDRAFEQKSQLVREITSLRSAMAADALEKEALTKRVQILGAELAVLTGKYDTLACAATGDALIIPDGREKLVHAYQELERKFQNQRTKLHVVNELLQREIIKSHEHYKAEMVAAYEREQALKELNTIYSELEQQKGDPLQDEAVAIGPGHTIGSGAIPRERVASAVPGTKRLKNRRKCLGGNLPKMNYSEASC
jgi:hypothetical protein